LAPEQKHLKLKICQLQIPIVAALVAVMTHLRPQGMLATARRQCRISTCFGHASQSHLRSDPIDRDLSSSPLRDSAAGSPGAKRLAGDAVRSLRNA
jgi:hypothetical protein